MFFDLVKRNSRRDRRENGLYFSSMLLSIILFYILLALSQQDVMFFLKKMESDAVGKLLELIPVFYCMTLGIMFFLIYFANKYQLDRRSHELGMYMMLGMRRFKLFRMLLLEDLCTSMLALLAGLPIGILLSEMISLVTSKLIGLGIIGHHFSFSLQACVFTVLGFLVIRAAAFLLLSGRLFRRELQELLVPAPVQSKREWPKPCYALSFAAGCALLVKAYSLGNQKDTWRSPSLMGGTLIFGLLGTFLLFWGLRVVITFFARQEKKGIGVFTFRQLQEMVAHQSHSLAVSSLLILAAMACFGVGIGNAVSTGGEKHLVDYTFCSEDYEDMGVSVPAQDGIMRNQYGADGKKNDPDIVRMLKRKGYDSCFSELLEIQVGYPAGEGTKGFASEELAAAIREVQDDDTRESVESYWMDWEHPDRLDPYIHLIRLSGYNALLGLAGEEPLRLANNKVFVYQDPDFAHGKEELDGILSKKPEIRICGESFYLTGTVQTTKFVADQMLTLSHALIVPDEAFDRLADYTTIYYSAVLDPDYVARKGLMQAMEEVNARLDADGFHSYDCYLQSMGRQLFYLVATSYIMIYLAVIFLVISNTVLGVNFLMQLKKTGKRYQTIIRLGGSSDMLCQSAGKQIRWYFGLPVFVAAFSSIFAVKSLTAGLFQADYAGLPFVLKFSGIVILLLVVVECVYIAVVTRAGRRYIAELMEPVREE